MIEVSASYDKGPDMRRITPTLIIATLDRISGEAQSVAVLNAPKDTGALWTSIHMVREYNPPAFTGGIQTNMPVAIVMEEGRRPGMKMPPFEPIFRWVGRKLMLSGPEQINVTQAVRLKIKKKGIEGRHFFRSAEAHIKTKFARHIETLGLDIKRAWDKGGA